ncbi:hypothetical protein [Nocardia sp. NPDC057030]|uniref:hypothetical protein n=1 Tax=unclassified Nocardia TaxID=2637762 RepID=UPI00362CDED3
MDDSAPTEMRQEVFTDGEVAGQSKRQRRRRREKARRLRKMAKQRVAERKAVGCPRPDKAAYSPNDDFERKLQERALGPGMEMYVCRCGFSHNGHSFQVEVGPL